MFWEAGDFLMSIIMIDQIDWSLNNPSRVDRFELVGLTVVSPRR